MDLDSLLQRLGPAIGQGATTVVYAITNAPEVALKEVLVDGLSDDTLRSLESLQDVLPRLCHPNILGYKKMAKRDSNFYLLMVRYPSSLDSLIRTHRRQKQAIPTAMLIKVAYQVAAGLAYLHDPAKRDAGGKPLPSLVHGRVKPVNILVNEDKTQFVLSDAGVCTEDAHGGVIAYTAPEVRAGAAPTPASDMWSLGAVLYELATGSRPAEDGQIRLEAVGDAVVREVISQLLVLEPEGRMFAKELVEVLSPGDEYSIIANAIKVKVLEVKLHTSGSMGKHKQDLELRVKRMQDIETKMERMDQLESGLALTQQTGQRLIMGPPTSISNTSTPGPGKSIDSTLLMWAAKYGEIAIVRNLIAAREGLRQKDRDDKTALMSAAQNGHIRVVKLLVNYERGMKDNDGKTALMSAAQNGHVSIVKALVDHEKRMQMNGGKTALMLAAQNGHIRVVKLLVNYERGMKDSDGKTALTYAREYNRQGIINILSQYPEERA